MASIAHLIRRRRERKSRIKQAKARTRFWNMLIAAMLLFAVVGPLGVLLGGAAVVYVSASAYLPLPQETTLLSPVVGPTRLYDRDGQHLLFSVEDPLGDQRRWVTLDELPRYVVDATLISEDEDFLLTSHYDPIRTLSGMWSYILGTEVRGGSSITSRLVRNALLPRIGSTWIDRPLLEMVLVTEINRQYPPREVLEWHLNTNYYGSDAYGIDAAAQVYFGKSAQELTLDEAALLAAIPTAPQFNPFDNITAARGRQSELLRRMLGAGLITQAEFQEADGRVTTVFQDPAQLPVIAPDFSIYARRQAENILDWLGLDGAGLVARGGLTITTTLDYDLYEQTECVVRIHTASLAGQAVSDTTLTGGQCISTVYLPDSTGTALTLPPDNPSIIVLDVRTGEILTMIGPATDVSYQPGVTLQPFVYFEGFRSALYTPATMVLDIPMPFPGPNEGTIFQPTNPDGEYRGPLNLRDAMGAWLVPPAFEVADSQRINNVLVSAHAMGINSLSDGRYDISLLQSGGAVSLLDMSYAYIVFASLHDLPGFPTEPIQPGYRTRDPIAVLRIEAPDGTVLWDYDDEQIQLNRTNIILPELGYLITDILSDTSTRRDIPRANAVLDMGRPAAVVSGVTTDYVDNWTIGYTPQFLTGVHFSREDRIAMSLSPYGLEGTAPIWRAVMQYLHERNGVPPNDWQRPVNIVERVVCDRSGLYPGPDSQCSRRDEIFLADVIPTAFDTYWQTFRVNSDTGLLATANTSAALVVERTYFVPPPDAMEWWQANGQPLPPTQHDTISAPDIVNPVQITRPEDLSYVSGQVEIFGTLDPTDMQYYQIAFGVGINPNSWLEIGGQQTSYAPGVRLGVWDTAGLDGLYTLRLTAVLNDGTRQDEFIYVTVDNIPPTIILEAGTPGQTFRFGTDAVIPINALVNDNLSIARVEFYVNEQFYAPDVSAPFGFDFEITRPGVERFRAVVFDAVGNQASAELEIEVVR